MSELAICGGKPVRSEPWPTYPQLGEREAEVALRVIRSGNLSAQFGKEVEKFEGDFADYIGIRHAVAVSTGTAALHVALASLGIGVGDEVIVPSYTFLATATAVLMANAIPVFADSDPEIQGISLPHVKNLVTSRTKAIIPVHANGFPLDMDPLMEFAGAKGIAVIEDCSHAHGAEHRGRKVGAIGHINAFSFQQKKNLSLGEGGMVTTDDDALAERARAFRSFGDVDLAYNYRMTELHGAIGRVRLEGLDAMNRRRVENAEYLHEALAGLWGLTTQQPLPGTKCVYYNFVLRCDPAVLNVPRDRIIEALNAEGIPVTRGYAPVHRHRSFRSGNCYGRGCPYACPYYTAPQDDKPNYADGACPTAEDYCDHRNMELKVHPPAGVSDMEQVARAIRKVIEGVEELA